MPEGRCAVWRRRARLWLSAVLAAAAAAGRSARRWIAPHDPLAQDLLLAACRRSGSGRRARLLARHRQPRPRRALAPHLRRAHRADRRLRRRHARLPARHDARPARRLFRAAGSMSSISRLIDIWMAFPPVLLSILLVAVLGAGLHSVIIAIVVIDWTRFARVVRAETHAAGAAWTMSPRRRVAGHRARRPSCCARSCPMCCPWCSCCCRSRWASPSSSRRSCPSSACRSRPTTPTWGGMIAEGRQIIYQAWWVLVFPLVTLFLTVLAFNQLGDGLRQSLRSGAER